MAKVVGPLHSSEARGSVGSLTYNTWRGISIVKARAGPTIQYSDDQVAVRALAAVATASWQGLTDEQRAAWGDYADGHTDCDWTGNPQRLSGYNWYVRINVRRQLVGGGIETSPPTHSPLEIPENLQILEVPGVWYINWVSQGRYSPWDLYYEFYAVGPHSAGRHPHIQAANRIGYKRNDGPPWQWGPLDPGQYTVFARPIHTQGTVGMWERITKAIP